MRASIAGAISAPSTVMASKVSPDVRPARERDMLVHRRYEYVETNHVRRQDRLDRNPRTAGRCRANPCVVLGKGLRLLPYIDFDRSVQYRGHLLDRFRNQPLPSYLN